MRPPRRRPAALLLGVVLLAAACGGGGDGDGPTELTVFAAASLTEAFNDLADDFSSANPGVGVTYNFAGSQQLAAQIEQGAPAAVFASADQAQLEAVAGLVAEPRVFASNLLQIVVEEGNPNRVGGLADLARRDLKVVLAAPDVPVGRYARQALDEQGVQVQPVSLEQDVKAVVAKVALGEADAGIVYVSDAAAAADGADGVDIPADQNVPATYPIAAVRDFEDQRAAQAFVDFVRSPEGQSILRRHGFAPPPPA
jgi:molybdate transport system substrate-binding protein